MSAAQALRRASGIAAGLALVAGLAGCGGQNCQNSCRRVYDAAECGVAIPGTTAEELIRQCEIECRDALKTPGELGTYNPYERAQAGTPEANYTLANEIQAATWMDCVWELECEQMSLQEGLCWPIP